MMSLTFGLFNQVSGLGPLGPLVLKLCLIYLTAFIQKIVFLNSSGTRCFLAYLSHSLRVSYCLHSMSIVQCAMSSIVGRPLCVVCCQQLLQTSPLKLIGLGPFNIWYVALPSGPLPSLFRWWPLGPKWP